MYEAGNTLRHPPAGTIIVNARLRVSGVSKYKSTILQTPNQMFSFGMPVIFNNIFAWPHPSSFAYITILQPYNLSAYNTAMWHPSKLQAPLGFQIETMPGTKQTV
jgi:hypothetical protein